MKILEKLPSYINESDEGKLRVNILTYLNRFEISNYDDVKSGVSQMNSVSEAYQKKNFMIDSGEIRKDELDDHLYKLRNDKKLDWRGGQLSLTSDGRELYAKLKELGIAPK